MDVLTTELIQNTLHKMGPGETQFLEDCIGDRVRVQLQFPIDFILFTPSVDRLEAWKEEGVYQLEEVADAVAMYLWVEES